MYRALVIVVNKMTKDLQLAEKTKTKIWGLLEWVLHFTY